MFCDLNQPVWCTEEGCKVTKQLLILNDICDRRKHKTHIVQTYQVGDNVTVRVSSVDEENVAVFAFYNIHCVSLVDV